MPLKNLITKEETTIKSYQNDTEENYDALILTDKILYVEESADEKAESTIIDIQSIDSLEKSITQHKSNTSGAMLIAALLILAGTITAVATGIYLLFIATGVGIIMLIVAAIVGTPKYTSDLVIHSHGVSHYINIHYLSQKEITELQKLIFQAKDKL